MSTPEQDRLAEIKARAAQATPGPWRDIPMGSDGSVVLAGGQTARTARRIGWANELNDGPFIAHSREDVDWLIAEVERLRAAHSRSTR